MKTDMKLKTCIFFILLYLFAGSLKGQGLNQKISVNISNATLDELAIIVKEQAGVTVYFKGDWARNVQISIVADSISPVVLLETVLKKYGVRVSQWNNALVLIPNKSLIAQLPPFDTLGRRVYAAESGVEGITQAEEKYLIGRRPDVIETIVVGDKSKQRNGNKVRVNGRLKDEETGEPIIGATIYIEETGFGTSSDQNGFFNITLKAGAYNARFDCLGQKSKTYLLQIFSDGEIAIAMQKSIVQIDEVFVYGDKSKNITTREAGLEKIPIKTLKELPMMMGERDIIRVSELLPGIVSVGEGSSGINVRGGSSDQNGFYINKIPIYNTSHVFGFYPAFNPDLIKDFSIYKGHIPVEYGGRLSSVFDIVARQGNRKRFSVRGGINLFSTSVTVEGPIIKDTCSMLFSARSSYSDWILNRLEDPTIRNSSASFNDFAFSSNYEPTKNNQISLFTYYSNDYFKLSDINEYSYYNMGASVTWRHTFSPSTRSEISLIASQYSFSTIDKNEPTKSFKHQYGIGHYEAKTSISYLLNDKNKVEGGLSAINYALDRGTVSPFGESSLIPIPLGIERGLEGTAYVSDTYDPFSWLNVSLGLRYSFFAPMGEREVYTYFENNPLDLLFVKDTISYGRFEPIKWYHGPEVRASVNFKTDRRGAIKVAFNQTRQNLFMLNNSVSIAPNTQWKLADAHIRPSTSQQISLGLFRDFPKAAIETSVEVFVKKTEYFTEFKDGANFIGSPHVETMVLQGNQNAYGIEVMVKRTTGRLNGWIAYTYSRSVIQVDGSELWMKINEGYPYASNYDIPNVVNVVGNYRFSRRFNLSTTITYQQGRPITYPLSVYYLEGLPAIDYSRRNEYRIPDYFRVDLSLSVEGNLKKKKLFHSSWNFGVYNLTGRNNPHSIYFKSENGKIKGYKYSIVGVPLFTATWIFKLGNYAAD
jgi:hypothetical protein